MILKSGLLLEGSHGLCTLAMRMVHTCLHQLIYNLLSPHVAQRRKLHSLKLAHKCLHNVGPTYLHHKFRYTSDVSGICTRGSHSGKLYLNRPRTEFYRKSFEYSTGRLWNSLPSNIRALDSLVTFTNACRRILHLF